MSAVLGCNEPRSVVYQHQRRSHSNKLSKHGHSASNVNSSSGFAGFRSSNSKYKSVHQDDWSARDVNRDEVIQIDAPEQWAEDTTCVTGNTSEKSVSYDDLRRIGTFADEFQSRTRCLQMFGLALTVLICLIAYMSPIAMVLLPQVPLLPDWVLQKCGAECEGLLIEFSFKLLILVVGAWALFVRRSLATLPRVFVYRAILLALVFMIAFAYWLFYGVRILINRESNYKVVVMFSLSMVDALLFVHYLCVVLLEIRHLRSEFKLHVVRSPDGESRTYDVGALSVQRAAIIVLQNYYRDFAVYNPFLERLPTARAARASGVGKMKGGSVYDEKGPCLKIYDIDGPPGGAGGGKIDPQAIMAATARKRDSAHNERFYEELEWERRVKKRRARLLVAAEEAFTHVRRMHEEKGPCVPMDPHEAAQAIFPSLARCLAKYLRVTRQQPRHSADQVVNHLANCILYDMSPRAFLDRFFNANETPEASPLNTSWSVVCDRLVNRPLSHGLHFQLRCQSKGSDAGVFLMVTVTKMPHLNLTEEYIDPKNNRFVLRMNSETSV